MTTAVVVIAVVAYLAAVWFLFRALLRTWLDDFGNVDITGVVWAAYCAILVPIGLFMLAIYRDGGEPRDLTRLVKRIIGGRP